MFLFKSKGFDPAKYESELKKISNNLSKNEKKLRKLKSQKDYYRKIIPLYLSAGYVIYFSYVYQMGKFEEPKTVLYLLIIPLLIGLVYYSLLSFFDYLINDKESYIEYLKNEHNEKITILKEKTNFDKTRDLLVRFSNGQDLKEMEREANEIEKKKQEYVKMIQSGGKNKILEDLQKTQNFNTGLYDHFLNVLLGENELGPDKRYALICDKCFNHNGLAPPGKLPTEVEYKCPNCGFMNGQKQDYKQLSAELKEGNGNNNSTELEK